MSEIVTNLYDMNKMMISQLPCLERERLEKLVDDINILDNGERQYFMLLSNEKRDYTVFNLCMRKEETLGNAVLEVLLNRGKIKEYEVKGSHDAIEIWANDTFYALFPYDLGVIEC